mgnify:CR=1 FL=1
MGIEPTDLLLDRRPDGFEDRAEHQLKKHFQLTRASAGAVFRLPPGLATFPTGLRATSFAAVTVQPHNRLIHQSTQVGFNQLQGSFGAFSLVFMPGYQYTFLQRRQHLHR